MQTDTYLKSATETLEMTKDNPNENIFQKQPPVVFYKRGVVKYFAKFIDKHLCQNLFFNEVVCGLQLY